MKNRIIFIYILLLTSCSGLQRLTIEVLEPAQVIFPADIANIVIVNNSAPQPGDGSINCVVNGRPVEGIEINSDSIASVTTSSLASHLKKTRFFDRVLVSPLSLRNDSNWMDMEALPESFKTEVFETLGFDGIISIDRLLFQFNHRVENGYFSNFYVNSTTCSIHLYDRKDALSSFTVSDTLLYITFGNGDYEEMFRTLPESLIRHFIVNIGEQVSRKIVPGWCEKERYLYTGLQSRMNEAFRFTQKNDWVHAIVLWKNEYEQSPKPQLKGWLASNLAVAYEMSDRLEMALQWAVIAKNHFLENDQTATSPENTRINTYTNDLQKRIKDNYLIDLQWGISNKSSGTRE